MRIGLALFLLAVVSGCAGSVGGTVGIAFTPNFFLSDGSISVAGVRAEASQICCDGLNVYVVWADTSTGNILFNYSIDAGANWQPQAIQINNVAGNAFEPRICCDGLRVYVAWPDGRSGRDDVYFNYSADGGATWQPQDTRLDTKVTGSSGNVRICCDTPFVYVAWEDTRDGRSDIYCNSSSDGGLSWQVTEQRVDRGDALGSFDSTNMEICCALFRVFVIWEDERNDPSELISDIYFNCSENGGLSWLLNSVRLNTDAAGTFDHTDPVICCSSQFVYAAWSDRRNGQPDIFVNYSTDFGLTWQLNDRRIETDTPGLRGSDTPSICCSLASVWVTWSDDRLGAGNDDVFVNYSTDGGISWQPQDERLNTVPAGTNDSVNARICCDGRSLYVVWEDDRNGLADVRFTYSTDSGLTWATSDLRLDTDGLGAAQSLDPALCCDGFNVYVIWLDDRNGQDEVLFNGSRQ